MSKPGIGLVRLVSGVLLTISFAVIFGAGIFEGKYVAGFWAALFLVFFLGVCVEKFIHNSFKTMTKLKMPEEGSDEEDAPDV